MLTEFQADELIFRQGDPANRFYLILDGTVSLEARSGDGWKTLLQEIGAGDVLEVALEAFDEKLFLELTAPPAPETKAVSGRRR